MQSNNLDYLVTRLNEATNKRIPEWVKWISNSVVYIYGTTNLASYCYKQLKKYGIDIAGVVVTELKGVEYFQGIKVSTWDSSRKKVDDKITIVAAFNVLNNRMLIENLLNDNVIDKVFILNGCELWWNNGFRFPRYNDKLIICDDYYMGMSQRNLNSDFFRTNNELFLQTYQWLEDDMSKKIWQGYLEGHIEYTNFPLRQYWKEADVESQYFPQDLISLTDEEVFVDCGAYTGDTLQAFLKRVKGFNHYYAIEPDERRVEDLMLINDKRVSIIQAAAWNSNTTLNLSCEHDCGEVVLSCGDNTKNINAISIDNLLLNKDKATFIKMDIEGAELEALKGAKEMIRNSHPKLAICVYHKREDLITIPQFIKSIDSTYRLYLRAHFPYVSEVVLYAL